MRVQKNFLIAYFGKRDKWTGLGLVHKAGSRFGKCFSVTGLLSRTDLSYPRLTHENLDSRFRSLFSGDEQPRQVCAWGSDICSVQLPAHVRVRVGAGGRAQRP